MKLHPAERSIMLVTAALAVVDAVLIWWKGISVSPDFFTATLCLGAFFIALGQFYRSVRNSERIALTMHVFGLHVVYWLFCSVFNLVILPLRHEPIDAVLVEWDAALGFSWPAWCAWMAAHPVINALARTAYMMTSLQMLLCFTLLGFAADRRRLHIALLTGVIASLAVVFVWSQFPSVGAAGYWKLDPQVAAAVQPIFGSPQGVLAYGLIENGLPNLSSIDIKGLVGFPSFHTVMGLLCLMAVWPYRAYRNATLVTSAFLFPSIFVHGGHNVIDMLAGAIIAAIAWKAATIIFEAQERIEQHRLPASAAAVPVPET